MYPFFKIRKHVVKIGFMISFLVSLNHKTVFKLRKYDAHKIKCQTLSSHKMSKYIHALGCIVIEAG